MATKTKEIKGPRGKRVKIAEKQEKEPQKEIVEYVAPGSTVDTEELFNWFKAAYPGHQPVDRDNGRTMHLKGKKVVKMPTQENKGGCFFGKHLNRHLTRLKQHLINQSFRHETASGALQLHTKGNYRVPRKVKIELLDGIKYVIASIYPPHEIG